MRVKQIKTQTGLSLSTIYKLIETIDSKHKTKIGRIWEIDESVIRNYFFRKRIPKEMNRRNLISYCTGKDWDFIGNFHVRRLKLEDNKSYSKLIFEHLPKNSEMVISFERNSIDEFFHTHFLICTNQSIGDLKSYLDLIVGQKEIGKGKDYFVEIFDKRRDYGVFYSLKSDFGFELMKK